MPNRFLKDYFDFNKQQRVAILVLLGILLSLFALKFYLSNRETKPTEDYSKIDQWMDSVIANNTVSPKIRKYNFKEFDINTITEDDFQALGFTPKETSSFIKYRKFYGFKKKEDFGKLYFVKDSIYEQFLPYITISPVEKISYAKKEKYEKYPPKKVFKTQYLNLNLADTGELKEIRGIGSYLAKQIVWYRTSLGGYIHVEQLEEVRGMHLDNYHKIKTQLYIKNPSPKKITINTVDYIGIIKHPYFNKEATKAILNHRKKYGNIENLNELIKITGESDEWGLKIEPYLVF